MGRKLRLMILFVMVILMMGQVVYAEDIEITQKDIDDGISFCKDYPVLLQVNGIAVESDVPPVIIKEKTLIPAKAVFENMGATVTWDEAARVVEVSLGTSDVKLTIDSKIAFVNGSQVKMDVPAMIIDSRTLIPVRFVAESLACVVGWDDLSRTVKITSPAINETTTISAIDLVEKSDKYRITIQGEGIIEGYKSFAYDSPERFGVDVKSAMLSIDDSHISANSDILKAIRFSQFESETVRVVIDLKAKVAGKVSFSSDKNSIYIDFDKDQASDYDNLGDVTEDGLPVVDWRATEKLVIIDPGHGGKDTGSQAIRDGVEILNEKDVNLDVALRLDRMLKAAGVSTYILRETDTTITLYERPTLANAANGDLYVSIHNNSSVNASANGIETYYNSKANECDYGIYSKHLAEAAMEELTKTIGICGRGVKSEPAYAVLNKTQMPAIIIEGAFLSNTDNLKLMMTDEFRENYALATAKAIIQILNESVEE